MEYSIRCLHQGWVELILPDNLVSIARATVLFVVFLEVRVGFDRVEGWFPFGLPVLGDVKDTLHEDLVVNENLAAKIFADVFHVVLAAAFIDSVRIAILPLPDGRPTGEWS